MNWKGAVQQGVVAVASSLVIAMGVYYTQLVRLDEQVQAQNEKTLLRIELLLEKTALLREEQQGIRRQIEQLQQQVWARTKVTEMQYDDDR